MLVSPKIHGVKIQMYRGHEQINLPLTNFKKLHRENHVIAWSQKNTQKTKGVNTEWFERILVFCPEYSL